MSTISVGNTVYIPLPDKVIDVMRIVNDKKSIRKVMKKESYNPHYSRCYKDVCSSNHLQNSFDERFEFGNCYRCGNRVIKFEGELQTELYTWKDSDWLFKVEVSN